MNDLFWTGPNAAEDMRAFIELCFVGLKITPEAMVDRLKEELPGGMEIPTSRMLRNFIGKKTKDPNRTQALTNLVLWLLRHVKSLPDCKFKTSEIFTKVERLAPAVDAVAAQRLGTTPTAEGLDAAIQLVAELMRVSPSGLADLPNRIFRPEDEDVERRRHERHFLCYRYHSAPGYIAKSFLAVIGNSADVPGVCRFVNVFRDQSGVQRMSEGMILPMVHGLYFLGQAGGGDALKIIAMRVFAKAKPFQDGLMISYDDDSGIVCSRIVLVATQVKNSADVGIGVFPEGELAAEIAAFRPRLKNRIHFTLSEDLMFSGKPIDQGEMVAKVSEAFKGEDGKAKLTDGSGKPFNPASSSHYTFNSALKMWSVDED